MRKSRIIVSILELAMASVSLPTILILISYKKIRLVQRSATLCTVLQKLERKQMKWSQFGVLLDASFV